jgi:hypothetical protein
MADFHRRLSERSVLMRFSVMTHDDAVLADAARFDANTSIVVLAVVPGIADELVVAEARCVPTRDGSTSAPWFELTTRRCWGLGTSISGCPGDDRVRRHAEETVRESAQLAQVVRLALPDGDEGAAAHGALCPGHRRRARPASVMTRSCLSVARSGGSAL